MDINFYKKQTVLNDILENTNIVIVDNSQLLSSINKAKLNKSEYLVSNTGDINIDYKNSTSNLTRLYISHYGIDPTKTSITNAEIVENIKRYNNCEYSINIDESNHPKLEFKNGVQQKNEYNNYNYLSQTNSLVLDTTYNSIYYTQYDKMNLMAYHINLINGFNYDNHMLYFNIDNEYICSLNNTLYYNYNKIRTTSTKDKGISSINPKFFNVKNLENNYYKNNAILSINKDFKYDLFTSINKLKNIYYDCKIMSDTLSYYANIDDYNNNYLDLVTLSYSYYETGDRNIENNLTQRVCYNYITNILFENTKLYYTDRTLGIDSLEINDADTLYVNNIDNINLRIGYIPYVSNNYEHSDINSYNMNLFKNRTSLTVDDNKINTKISYNYDYKYFSEIIKTSFVEISKSVWENQTHTNIKEITKENVTKFPITSSYYINISSNIDQIIFKNSGLNIIYNGSPYLSYLNNVQWEKSESPVTYNNYDNTGNSQSPNIYSYWSFQNITIPQTQELNIRSINSKVFSHSYSKVSCIRNSFKNSENSYYILSSKNLFYTSNLDFEKSKIILDGTHIYLKGTAYDKTKGCTNVDIQDCIIQINNGKNLTEGLTFKRGLNFVAIDKQTFEVIDLANYDTYGQAANDSSRHNDGITLLKNKLNDIKNNTTAYNSDDVFICIVSYDAIGWDNELISLLQEFGMDDLPYTNIGRYPFLFVGCKDLNKGNGITKMRNAGSYRDIVELSLNGDFGPQYYQNGNKFIYLKGTSWDNEYGWTSDVQDCIIQINNGNNLTDGLEHKRGLNFVAIDKQTFEVIDQANYDTYGQSINDSSRYNDGITLLKNKLNDIKNSIDIYNNRDVFICLVSYDAIGWSDELISLLQEFGMSDLPYIEGWRYPFLFFGYKGLGKSNGITKMRPAGTGSESIVELSIPVLDVSNQSNKKIQITSPEYFQITGLDDYNCEECRIHINNYIFNELYSQNIITKIPNPHYYQIAPLYIENYNGEYIDNNYNSYKEYVPILNNYPTKYINDKFFTSKMYLENNYPTKEELNTCISKINDLWTNGSNKLYLYEIQKIRNDYYLIFYSLLYNNSDINVSTDDIDNFNGSINISDSTKLLYNNQFSNYLSNKNRLYQYLYQYLNNFISF